MSGREGHDAMTLQREYVMQLLGTVTGTLAEAPAATIHDSGPDKRCLTSYTAALTENNSNAQTGDRHTTIVEEEGKRDLECQDLQWESSRGSKRPYSSKLENIDKEDGRNVHKENHDAATGIPNKLNVESFNTKKKTLNETSDSSNYDGSDSGCDEAESVASNAKTVKGEKDQPFQQLVNDTTHSDGLNGSSVGRLARHKNENKRRNLRASEDIDDLLKRAKEFSSLRVPLTGSMFANVTQNKSEIDYTSDENISEDQVLNGMGSITSSPSIVVSIKPNKKVSLPFWESNTVGQFDCIASMANSNAESKHSASSMDQPVTVSKSHDDIVQDSSTFNLSNPPLLMDYHRHFIGANNYTKGCKWSPDGRVLLTLSADQHFRLFQLPVPCATHTLSRDIETLMLPLESCCPALTLAEGEMVYDYLWYPLMTKDDPTSHRFVCCCRGLPVHMWDANSGELVCSYRPFNHLDELAPTSSLGFSRDGCQLVCGFNKCIRIFHTNRPGRQCTTICGKRQNGIISCFDFHPRLHSVLAAGSYLGSVGLYSTNTNKLCSLLEGHTGGITQLTFSSDGYRLYTGARKDCELLCWDIRQLGRVLSSHERTVETHQRVAFALSSDDTTLITGSTDGVVSSWRVGGQYSQSADSPLPATQRFTAHDDCANGVSMHPHYPVLATSSGQRRRPPHPDDASDPPEDQDRLTIPKQSTVRLWWLGA